MTDSLPCIDCGEPVRRTAPNQMVPFRCGPCRDERLVQMLRENIEAIEAGKAQKQYQEWQAMLSDRHQRGKHLDLTPGCEPCKAREAIEAAVLAPDALGEWLLRGGTRTSFNHKLGQLANIGGKS